MTTTNTKVAKNDDFNILFCFNFLNMIFDVKKESIKKIHLKEQNILNKQVLTHNFFAINLLY